METWLMEVDRRMRFLVIENYMTRNDIYGVYIPRVSSMKLHTVMLGIDVARRVLRGISVPSFRTDGARKHAPKIIACMG